MDVTTYTMIKVQITAVMVILVGVAVMVVVEAATLMVEKAQEKSIRRKIFELDNADFDDFIAEIRQDREKFRGKRGLK